MKNLLPLNSKIQGLYNKPLELPEAQEASNNLLSLFDLLIDIDTEKKRKKQGLSNND